MSTDSFSQALRPLTLTKGSYIPPGTDHLDPNTFEFFCYFNSGSMVSPCFLCNPLNAPELAHLAGFFLNTWHGFSKLFRISPSPILSHGVWGRHCRIFPDYFLVCRARVENIFLRSMRALEFLVHAFAPKAEDRRIVSVVPEGQSPAHSALNTALNTALNSPWGPSTTEAVGDFLFKV